MGHSTCTRRPICPSEPLGSERGCDNDVQEFLLYILLMDCDTFLIYDDIRLIVRVAIRPKQINCLFPVMVRKKIG